MIENINKSKIKIKKISPSYPTTHFPFLVLPGELLEKKLKKKGFFSIYVSFQLQI